MARIAHREPQRWLAKVIHWKDAMYRETMRALHWRASDPDRERLGRGLRGRTGRRWGDPLQKVCGDTPWQTLALDKAAWSQREEQSMCRMLRRRNCRRPAPGRFMLEATPD